MGFFSQKPVCRKFFTYATKTLDFSGLSAGLSSSELADFDVKLGQFKLSPEFVKVSESLMLMDLQQFALCQTIVNIRDRTERDRMFSQLAQIKMDMMRMAAHPEMYEYRESNQKQSEREGASEPIINPPGSNAGMNIMQLLDNPATIGEALLEAAKLPFRGDDKVRFQQKRQKYIDGLSAHTLPNWVGQMQGFLSQYDGSSVGAIDGEGFRSYTLDREKQWHYLDKKNFRERVGEICSDRDNPVKAIFIEHNVDAFSDQMDEILRSFIKEDHEEIHDILSPTEGKMSHVINLDNNEKLGASWADFMRKIFRVSPNHDKIPAELRLNTDFYAKSHIIVHSVGKLDSAFLENFKLYYNFWATLCPEHPVFLCLFLPPEHALPRDIEPLPHWILCYYNEYEAVGPYHFTCFFKDYTCYQKDEELCRCNPMPFCDAVKKLRYC